MMQEKIKSGKMLNLGDIFEGMSKMLYRGVVIQKFPLDYVMYQMIISEVRPDLIIEIGTMHGGSALYFADLQELLGIENGEVHSIDMLTPKERQLYEKDNYEKHEFHPNEDPNYPEKVASHPRIKLFNKGYQGYDLSNCKGFERILVIDDGSHVYDEVIEAMNKFKDVISVGSYLIIEDGNCEEVFPKPEFIEMWHGGPLRATKQFIAENDNYRVDYKWCDMFGINATFNTYGYLKRVK